MDPEDLETTLQCEAIYIPPAARRDDDEDRTLVMAPPLGTREGDLRLVVFGIWAVAALLVALLLVLAR